MSGVMCRANSGEVAVVAATAKTVLQIVAAANHRVKVLGFSIFGKGTTGGDTPMRVRVVRQSSAGTMTAGTVGTHLSKNNSGDDETLQTTVRVDAGAEPTLGDVISVYEVHPQSGQIIFFPFGQEIIIPGGGRLGIEVLAAQGQTVVASADLDE